MPKKEKEVIEEAENEEKDDAEDRVNKDKKHDSGAADLEKVEN